ncbi:MarR family winged helix-turn-helix transcriptional regulator [Streptomyces polyrhachis]|uniref:MarR family winged helix-turn-helix transcriptional regulator n=1 Tax=Streptomyces polyrhachis TaxID=1282885 RepID=A0ABW2G9E6_9ACTN
MSPPPVPPVHDGRRDSTDEHLDRWLPVLPDLDPDIEGAVTRAMLLTRHLRHAKERSLAETGLERPEFETLHALAGRAMRATPSELAAALRLAPASVTGRLDALERRGLVRRTPSAADRRRIDVEVTGAGEEAWRAALARLGREEERLLGALSAPERAQLAALLRRVMVEAESRAD